ncbi:hypothetical protein HPB49_014872 [Dermacentor silvarum]|uniref:Uncharacterized protein n=1 Tax=Dermacentor silvarum TaxID=543639 RepID=A0ACB8C486_DERSI|nr:hypothetical protein HPB49_014872 [Dermacentor silvarum]
MNTRRNTDARTVSAAELKLPPFWPTDPRALVHSTDLTRYHHIVSSLPPATTSEVHDLPLTQPAENAHQTLKEMITRRLTPFEPEWLRQLLNDMDLDLGTQSQLLNSATCSNSGKPYRYQQHVRYFFSVCPTTSAGSRRVDPIADTIMAAANPSASIANV